MILLRNSHQGPTKNDLQMGIHMKWIAAGLLSQWFIETSSRKVWLLVVHMKLAVLTKLDSTFDRVLWSKNRPRGYWHQHINTWLLSIFVKSLCAQPSYMKWAVLVKWTVLAKSNSVFDRVLGSKYEPRRLWQQHMNTWPLSRFGKSSPDALHRLLGLSRGLLWARGFRILWRIQEVVGWSLPLLRRTPYYISDRNDLESVSLAWAFNCNV